VGDLSEHFDRKEFACNCGCGADDVSYGLVIQLERLRNLIRRPIVIVSGVRCAAHNAIVGGKPDSAHLTGEAADISCIDDHTRWQMKHWISAYSLFNRVGNGKTFLHLDVSKTLPQEVEWIYP
jgi:uncharacterized protein YcbK (DUF882 family)